MSTKATPVREPKKLNNLLLKCRLFTSLTFHSLYNWTLKNIDTYTLKYLLNKRTQLVKVEQQYKKNFLKT